MTMITSKRRRVRRLRRPQLATQTPSTATPFSAFREIGMYAALIALSVLMHLWQLGGMAMHHDESIHAQFSWEFFTASSTFPCWTPNAGQPNVADTYCYNPVYHGPVLYLTTYLSYFLFGVSDATARLPMVVAGVLLVGSCWMLRPLVGRRTALLTAVLMLFSPSLLYFTRFARHDALAVLFTFWVFVGMFRFWHEREALKLMHETELPRQSGRWLYLSAASLALLWATHELVFIIIFIGVTFAISRLIWELYGQRVFVIASGALMLVCALMIVFSTPIHIPVKPTDQQANVLHLAGFGMLGLLTLLVGQLVSLRWSDQPTLRYVWFSFRDDDMKRLLLGALAAFAIPFVLCFSTFFTYPKGIIDGLYAGLAYWLGSQQSFARGDQPWYYYFMQLGIYEILPVTLMFVGFVAWLAKAMTKRPAIISRLWDEEDAVEPNLVGRPAPVVNPQINLNEAGDWETTAPTESLPHETLKAETAETTNNGTQTATPAIQPIQAQGSETISNLWVGFAFYWFFLALVVFSWAGEKMPWLMIHMTLPAVVAGAWALNRMIAAVPWKQGQTARSVTVMALSGLAVVMFVTASAFFGTDSSQTALQERINGIFLFLLIAGVGVIIWLLGMKLGWRSTSRLVGLGIASILALYTVRAQALAVYNHPDVPVELMVYTQTAPDVPIMVDTINEIAIAQTRIARSDEDPVGGKSMQILLSSGLEQPFAWYLRGWKNIQWRSAEQIAALTEADLQAPVAVFSTEHLGEGVVDKLKQAGYIEIYRSYQNWWFPEGGNLGGGGYKNRLYDPEYGCDPALRGQSDENGRAAWDCTLGAVEVLTWPFRISNWRVLRNYMLFREFPEGTQPGGREIVMFARQSVAPTLGNVAGGGGTSGGTALLRLVSAGPLSGNITQESRGIATGPDGAVYVADALANAILVYEVSGESRMITGDGENTLLEPSSVAVDSQGNVYVADTWNARIVKFDSNDNVVATWGVGEQVLDPATQKKYTPVKTPEEAQSKPLGFFGPRGVAVDNAGHVYIADTGNKRIVVTTDTGEYLGQIGTEGAAPGQFNEPIGLAVMNGQLYVGDTWNGRIQVFPVDSNGVPLPTPNTTWMVEGWINGTYLDPFMAVNPQGQVVVSVPSQNRATLYDNLGKALLMWGGNGEPDVSMSSPSGIAFAPDGSVYIAEKGTGQVQRWVIPNLR